MREVEEGKYRFNWMVQGINFLLRSYAKKPLSAKKLLAQAQKEQGLTDFGANFNFEAFEILVQSINDETPLHGIGRFFIEKKILTNLGNRLRAEALLKAHPEIQNRKLPKIVLITGMQRTGTTLLQRLLSSLPPFRGLRSWEVLEPIPYLGKKGEEKVRQRNARLGQQIVNWINPQFSIIHKINWNEVEEEVTLFDLSMMSTVPEAILRVPTYAAWVEAQDNRPAYEYTKAVLKIILRNDPAHPYLVLKSPHHMEFLGLFYEVFEEVKIIQLHRTPTATVPSMFNLVYFGNKTFCQQRDPKEIGEHWFRKNKLLCERAMQARGRIPPEAIMNIAYEDFISGKLNTLKEIFNFLHLDWSKALEEHATAFLAQNQQHKHGKHVYKAEWYGFSDETIQTHFAPYSIANYQK